MRFGFPFSAFAALKQRAAYRHIVLRHAAAAPHGRAHQGGAQRFGRAVQAIAHEQLHLPFQSGNDRVLKAMNRHYTREEYLKLAHYGRQILPELVLTSDVIVGFPGETEEEFEDTISLIEDVRYDALFTFIFSPRAGTPAAKMDDPTPKEEKNRRFDRLCAVQNRISLEIHQGYVGKTVRVLCDGRDKDLLTARTEGGRLVRFAGDDSLIGQFLDVTITGCTTWSLVGELR